MIEYSNTIIRNQYL